VPASHRRSGACPAAAIGEQGASPLGVPGIWPAGSRLPSRLTVLPRAAAVRPALPQASASKTREWVRVPSILECLSDSQSLANLMQTIAQSVFRVERLRSARPARLHQLLLGHGAAASLVCLAMNEQDVSLFSCQGRYPPLGYEHRMKRQALRL